mgnify:CR=1 FL=1|jgi:hypothetical protein
MEEEKKTIKDKEEEIKKKEKKIASNIKAEAEEIDKSLSEVIRQQATEDEAPQSRTFSLRKILGGDVLSTSFMRRQVWLCVLIALFIVIYIGNRYSCQQDIIEIDALQKELKDAKYKALSSNSKLTELSRQSNVLEMLKNNKDSTLKMPTQPPYIITVPDK